MHFWPKARRVLGDKIFRMDCSLAKTKHMDTHTHTVKREFFLPVCGFLLSPNCTISCTIAEYYLEAKSWKDYTRAIKIATSGARAPKFISHLSQWTTDLQPWAKH